MEFGLVYNDLVELLSESEAKGSQEVSLIRRQLSIYAGKLAKFNRIFALSPPPTPSLNSLI